MRPRHPWPVIERDREDGSDGSWADGAVVGGAEAKDATIPPPIVEEYVYDLYYRDIRDESATIPLGVGDGVTPMTVGAL